MKRKLIAAIGVAALAAGVAACGSSDEESGAKATDEAAAKPDSITVWLMTGAPEDWYTAVNDKFESEYGVEVNVEIQEWTGITDKITTALSEDGTVDVLEIGNTQTVGFASTTGLADLSDLEDAAPWNETMLESGRFEETLYAVPMYGANRVVIYDKDVWAEAGAEVPTTREEWLDSLAKIEENTDAQPIYLPGQNYYVAGGFMADEGGAFAVQEGDEWKGALSTPEAQAGMEFYKELAAFSTAPTDIDEASPQQSTEVVPNENIASWIGLGWEAGGAVAAVEEAGGTANFGYFPIPGKTADTPGHVFYGGSNFGVAERSVSQDYAKKWLEIATSQEFSQSYVDANGGGVVPNRTDVTASPEAGSFAEAMVAGAEVGYLPPLTIGWSNVETDPNPIKEYMTNVLNGEDYASAAETADAEITTRINRD